MDKEVLTDLAAAIRRRDFEEAEYQLDLLVRDRSGAQHAVSVGRYGGKAKAPPQPVERRKAA